MTYPKRHNKEWTKEEEKRLIEIMRKKIKKEKVEKVMKRTYSACKDKFRELTGSSIAGVNQSIDRIGISEHMELRRCSGEKSHCSYCGGSMKNKYGLMLTKSTSSHTMSTHYIWIHVYCLEQFLKTIRGKIKENEELIRKKISGDSAREMNNLP